MNIMRKLAAVAVALFVGLWLAGSANAGVVWSADHSTKDCSGNACLRMYWSYNVSNNIGLRLSPSISIWATDDGALNRGVDGGVLECWNDAGDVKFSKTAAQTNLSKGESRTWNVAISMSQTPRVTCRWFYKDLFADGSVFSDCAKTTARHFDFVVDDTGC